MSRAEVVLADEDADVRVAPVQWLPASTAPGARVGGWLARPTRLHVGARLVVVLHGVRRNGREYLESWRAWAQRTGRPVLAPVFSDEAWPGSRSYNLGNVLDHDGAVHRREQWASTALRALVADARTATHMTDPTWDLFGHSAGGQFAHRFCLLEADPTLDRIAVAGAGWFTVPDARIDWPYGLRHPRLPLDDGAAERWLRLPIVLLRGEHDRERDEHLRVGRRADDQGRNRWERAAHVLAVARARDPGCRWQLVDVPGAGHHEHEIAPVVHRRWDAVR